METALRLCPQAESSCLCDITKRNEEECEETVNISKNLKSP